MLKMNWTWLAALLALIQGYHGANILDIMPFPGRSHGIIHERLVRELSAKGHTVTYLTAAVPSKPVNKVKVIEIPNPMLKFKPPPQANTKAGLNMFEMRHMSAWDQMPFLTSTGLSVSETVLDSEPVKQLIRSDEKFDLVIAHNFMDESIMAGFAHRFKAPLIAVQPFLPNFWANYLVGNPAPSSFIPDVFLAFGTKMTFCERLENFIYGLVFEYNHVNKYLTEQDVIMKKHFGADFPPIHDILKNTSLVLVNHHYTLAYPRPYAPNMVEVGGMHIDEPKPLPADLQKFMDNSKDGVILFSLGSNLKSADLPPEKLKSILKGLSKLKQNVLWKFEADITDLPKNVRVMKWIPQSDVLAHPNLKLFITHGGLLSTTESVQRGVPVVGIPFLGDQPLNMKQVEKAGFGKTLNYDDITEETMYNAIMEVITDPRYREKAAEKSKLFKDNPMTPLDTAIWWIEYVIRHKGAKHLRSAAQDLNWFQLYLIDVYALALLGISVAVAVNVYIAKLVLRKICGKKAKNDATKQTEKKKN